jgi:hypothetical protein
VLQAIVAMVQVLQSIIIDMNIKAGTDKF